MQEVQGNQTKGLAKWNRPGCRAAEAICCSYKKEQGGGENGRPGKTRARDHTPHRRTPTENKDGGGRGSPTATAHPYALEPAPLLSQLLSPNPMHPLSQPFEPTLEPQPLSPNLG